LIDEFKIPIELPFPRNRRFCGREDLIRQLCQIFHPEDSPASYASIEQKSSLLYGMGGIGKTQIALEYAHRYVSSYSAIFWVDAKDSTTLQSCGRQIVEQLALHYMKVDYLHQDFIRISNELGIPGGIDSFGHVKQEALGSVWKAVKRWLQREGNVKWLLLVDNNDDFDAVNILDVLPTCSWGNIIITSRRPELGEHAHPILVAEIGEDDGLELLIKRMNISKKNLSKAG
jgi:Cdc6-like AAA superfamily ATPase